MKKINKDNWYFWATGQSVVYIKNALNEFGITAITAITDIAIFISQVGHESALSDGVLSPLIIHL